MKKLTILLLLIFSVFTSCEEVVQIDVPTGEPKLVINATFEVFFFQNPVVANTSVKLSLSAPYFDDTIPSVSNATVFVTNVSDNTIINFQDGNQDGNFTPITAFIPEDDVEYQLTVIYNNETYKGKATKVKSPTITNIVQGEETLFTGEETQILVSFNDDGARDDFYLFDLSNNLFLAIEDRFFNGSLYNFSYFYQEDQIELPATIGIKMSGITEDYFKYFRVLINQGGQNSGGPFQTVPASLLGNIINTSDTKNFPLGYFHISETDIFPISLVDKTN